MNLGVYAECDLLLEICVTQKGFFHFIPKEFQNFQKLVKNFYNFRPRKYKWVFIMINSYQL